MNRGLLAKLRPVALGRVSLEELLSDLVTGFARANPDVRFERNFDGLAHSFGEAIDLTIYRCIQEGVTNALRHGSAKSVGIRLGMRPIQRAGHSELISLNVTDDGSGFRPGTPFGFGISSMRERLRLLNGSLAIGPQDTGGTGLEIEIPLPAPTLTAV
jgi:two-component system sensor histidine kinase UhpB